MYCCHRSHLYCELISRLPLMFHSFIHSLGPQGANLFVYNIPETFSDADLAGYSFHFMLFTVNYFIFYFIFVYFCNQLLNELCCRNRLFGNFGQVLSTKVYTDKQTGTSRGFGFVSYSTQQEAEQVRTLCIITTCVYVFNVLPCLCRQYKD